MSQVPEAVMQRRLEFFKDKIKSTLSKIKYDIGELRYELYIAMVDKCDDYAELREMAELEMQLEFIEYTRGNIQTPLRDRQVDISDLNKICSRPEQAKYTPDESEEIETDGFFDAVGEAGGNEALAFALQRAIARAPMTLEYHPGYTDEEVDEAIGAEAEEADLIALGIYGSDEGADETYEGDDGEDSEDDFEDLLGGDEDPDELDEDDELAELLGGMEDTGVGINGSSGDLDSGEPDGHSSEHGSGEDDDTYEGDSEDFDLEQLIGGEGEGEEDGEGDTSESDGYPDETEPYDEGFEGDEDDELFTLMGDTSEADDGYEGSGETYEGEGETYEDPDEEDDFEDLLGGDSDPEVEPSGETYEDDGETYEDGDDESDEDDLDSLLGGGYGSDEGETYEDGDDGEYVGDEDDFEDLLGGLGDGDYDDPDDSSSLDDQDDTPSSPPPMRPIAWPKPKSSEPSTPSTPPPPVSLPPLPGVKQPEPYRDPAKPQVAKPTGPRTGKPPMAPRDIRGGKVFADPATQKMFERITGITGAANRAGQKAVQGAAQAARKGVSQASRRIAEKPSKDSFFHLPDE